MIKPKKNLEEENIFLRQELAKLKSRKKAEGEKELLKLLEKSRKRLLESQELYRELVTNARTIIIRMDIEGRFTFMNEYGLTFFGFEESEIVGKYATDTIVPPIESTGRDLGEMLSDIYKDPDKFSVNINENIKRNGERVWVEWHNKALFNENNDHIGHISIGIDITENKKNKDALIESEGRFRTIAETLPAMICVTRVRDSIILFTNEVNNKAFRLGGASIVGTTGPEYYWDPADREKMVRIYKEKGLVDNYLLKVKHADGWPFWIMTSVRPIKYQGEDAMIGVSIDVTITEKELIKLNEELLRSNNDLQQFAYVASHDLQEPLRMVASFTQLLQMQYGEKLDRTANEYIKFAVDGSKRMYELLNGLLTFSRIHSRGQQFDKVNLDLVLHKVKDNLRLRINETNANIKGERLPVVVADENQMIQLLQNLIENAIKFSKGDPHISVSSVNRKGKYFIKVRDNGIGIEPQYFEKIFRIFQRLHSPGEYKGTGIGLAICKKIVERHSGEIWVESKKGEGSTFIFTIPATH